MTKEVLTPERSQALAEARKIIKEREDQIHQHTRPIDPEKTDISQRLFALCLAMQNKAKHTIGFDFVLGGSIHISIFLGGWYSFKQPDFNAYFHPDMDNWKTKIEELKAFINRHELLSADEMYNIIK